MQNQMPAGNVAESELIARTLTETTTEKPAPRSEQDRLLIQETTTAQAQLHAALADAEVSALLSEHGYTAAQIQEGLTQATLAESAIRIRQYAMAQRAIASEEFVAIDEEARRDYGAFRLLARAIFTHPAARTEMGLRYGVPTDLKLFVPRARLGYTTVLAKTDYIQAMEESGMTPEQIQSYLAQLDTLIAKANASTAAHVAATRAVEDRKQAVKAMRIWMARFRMVTRYATRDNPDLAARIGV